MTKDYLILTKQTQGSKKRIISAFFQEDELVQISAAKEEEDIISNIYIGKVKNIIKNIQAAFVEFAPGQVCFLSLKESNHPIFCSGEKKEKIQIGDEIIVQIQKEDAKRKAPLGITDFSLTGKYAVLLHGSFGIFISSKIEKPEQKKALRKLAKPYLEEGFGYILRTNAVEAEQGLVEKELQHLKQTYQNLIRFGLCRTCFSVLYKPIPSYLWDVRDVFSPSLSFIKTDDKALYEQIKDYLQKYQPEDLDKLLFFQDDSISLSAIYGISAKLEQALNEVVHLKSGAYLVIQRTEALTVIDVNTGKAIAGTKESEETFYRVNCEAAKQIAKQIRLRNLSGIILVDFINTKQGEHKEQLLSFFREYLAKDPVKTVLVDMTALHLVEITRKKVRNPLYEQMLS